MSVLHHIETNQLHGQSNPSDELNRLFQLDYGNRSNVVVRLLGVTVGSGILYGHTGWSSALFWAISFLVAQLSYYFFLKVRIPRATPQDVSISALLLLSSTASFLWMPALMICENDRFLSICGAALVGCNLVYLVRRSDHAPIMVYGQILVVATVISLVFLRLIPQFTDPFAKLGLLGSGSALLYFFVEAAHVSRRLRRDAAEANLRTLQAEKMAAIGRLAGGVAHDFNNNLTAILGHLELLSLEEDPKERHASIHEAWVAARKASKTVKHLLVFARKERVSLEMQNSSEILDGLVSLTRKLIPTSVSIQVEQGLEDPDFLADRAQLMSALINLVENAVDAMPGGGELALSSAVVHFTKTQDLADGSRLAAGTYVQIKVKDQGHGIPAPILSKVLEPFFTTKPVGKGTGLGLSMALGVSKELGGGLTIATSEKGTAVSIFLPVTNADPHGS